MLASDIWCDIYTNGKCSVSPADSKGNVVTLGYVLHQVIQKMQVMLLQKPYRIHNV